MNRPTISSTPSSSAGRPDTVVPNTTSSSPAQRESSSPHAPCSSVLSVTCARRASSSSRRVRPSGSDSVRLAGRGSAPGDGGAVRRQRRRRGEARQHLAPVALGGPRVLPPQPRDVVAVRAHAPHLGRLARGPGAVQAEHLADARGTSPAVHQQVVEAPDEPVRVVRTRNSAQRSSGALAQLEAPRALLRQDAFSRASCSASGNVAPVLGPPGHLAPRRARAAAAGAGPPTRTRCAGRRGAAASSAQARREERRVQRALQPQRHLHLVRLRRAAGEGVKEHPLLHGRQRIQVLHLRTPATTVSSSACDDRGQREVRRRVAARVRPPRSGR